MIYLLGASHLMAILDACAAPHPGSQPKFGRGQPPAFQECVLREGVLPDRLKAASIYVGHAAPFWGPTLAALTPQGTLGVAPGFQALLASVAEDPEARALFVAMRGEEYFHLGLAGVRDPFDFVLPDRADLGVVPGRAVLPLEAVQAQLQRHLSHTFLAFTAIRRLCPRLPVVHIPPPPPAASEAVAAWAAAQGRDEPTQRLPTSVRLKLWLLHTRLLASFVAGLGVDSLPLPEEALQPPGTLRPEYLADAIHGNERYGALVCAQMAARVSGPALETAQALEALS